MFAPIGGVALFLDFPNFQQTRDTMQLANLIHGACSLVWITFAIGHIYIGTLGSEGSLEAMTTGYVSKEWAQQHHNLWYEEVKHTEQADTAAAPGSTGSSAPT